MNKTFFYKRPDSIILSKYDNLVGRLVIPSGNYIIQAKAQLSSIGSRWHYEEIFNAKLKCVKEEDEVLMSLCPRLEGPTYWEPVAPAFYATTPKQGAKDVVIFLQLAVKIDNKSAADFAIFSVEEKGLIVSGISIVAFQVEELNVFTSFDALQKFTHRKDMTEAVRNFNEIVKVKQ